MGEEQIMWKLNQGFFVWYVQTMKKDQGMELSDLWLGAGQEPMASLYEEPQLEFLLFHGKKFQKETSAGRYLSCLNVIPTAQPKHCSHT